ncbi:hypothetical protein SCAR479_05797 [Seiridium cardinale]|uniref:Uncharacterized protein n=1 Tax=Seiridium cardinale TaxID=138064 RepID=A0ABR2XUA9_9PEZI
MGIAFLRATVRDSQVPLPIGRWASPKRQRARYNVNNSEVWSAQEKKRERNWSIDDLNAEAKLPAAQPQLLRSMTTAAIKMRVHYWVDTGEIRRKATKVQCLRLVFVAGTHSLPGRTLQAW